MSDQKQAASAAVKAALLEVAGRIASGATREGYDETVGYSEAVSRLTTAYVQLIASGE